MSDLTASRSRERELDVLVAAELGAGSPAGQLLWSVAGQAPPAGETVVRRQVPRRSDGRTTDVVAERPDGSRLLIENKAADGQFEEGQPEGYRIEAREPNTSVLVVAPEAFLARLGEADRQCFDAVVSVEDLAASLERALDDAEDSTPRELVCGWSTRAAMLRTFAASAYTGNPDEVVAAFGDAYRALAVELTDGRVALEPGTLANRNGRFAEYAVRRPAPRPLTLQHKMYFGELDLRVPGWTATALEAHIEALPADRRPPAGWQVARPRSARKTKATGEVAPVLRFAVNVIPHDLPPFEDARSAVAAAVLAADSLGTWLAAHGTRILDCGPSVDTLVALVDAAHQTAKQLRLAEAAGVLQQARQVAISSRPNGVATR